MLMANTPRAKVTFTRLPNLVKVAPAQHAAWITVYQEYARIVANGTYGHLLTNKPDNVIWMMYENFSSLSLFINGPE